MEKPSEAGLQLFRLISGFMATQALHLMAKLGVADALADGPLPVDVLAERVGAHPDALFRMLRALSTVGVFCQTAPRTFAITEVGAMLRDGPQSMRHLALLFGEQSRTWCDAEHFIRTGQSAFEHVFGQPVFDYFATHPAAGATFDRAMAGSTAMRGDPLAALSWDDVREIVDIGGGSGRLLVSLLRRHPHLRGTVFDLPHVAESAQRVLRDEGLLDRTRAIGGDFFASVPDGADVYVLSRVLHDWDDDDCLRILASCRRAMLAKSRLLIIDTVLDEPPAEGPSVWIDLQMLVITGGRERTRSEWESLLAESGLRVERAEGLLVSASIQ